MYKLGAFAAALLLMASCVNAGDGSKNTAPESSPFGEVTDVPAVSHSKLWRCCYCSKTVCYCVEDESREIAKRRAQYKTCGRPVRPGGRPVPYGERPVRPSECKFIYCRPEF
jgi:hypothetical protein